MPPVVRYVRPGDEPALLAHLQTVFGGWPRVDITVPPIEHLKWKLERSREASECSVVALEGSDVIGALLFVGQRVRTRMGDHLAAHGTDWSVQPRFQGEGLMVALRTFATERLERHADINLGQTGHPHVVRMHKRIGYKCVGDTLHRFVVTIDNATDALRSDLSVTGVAMFDDRTDRLWKRAAGSFDYAGVRDRHWLNHRYCDERAGTYALRVVEGQDGLLGYSVVSSSKARDRGYIADLLALPGRTDVIESLIADALASFRRHGLSTAECWLPERHPYRAAIEAGGFVPRSRAVDTIFKTLRASQATFDFLEDPETALHLTMGDSDVV